MTNKTLLRHDFGAGILKSFKNKQKKKTQRKCQH